MMEECQLPQIHKPERVAYIAGAILEDAIQKHVENLKNRIQLTSNFSEDLKSIAGFIEKSERRSAVDPVVRVISRVFAEYSLLASDYLDGECSRTEGVTTSAEFARILSEIFKEELIEAEIPISLPRDLSGIFTLFSPGNCFMFLANVSALIYPKLSAEIDEKLCRLLAKKYGLSSSSWEVLHQTSGSQRLRYLQPFLRVHIQDEELEIIHDFYGYLKHPAINEGAGHFCYFTEQLFNYLKFDRLRGESYSKSDGVSSASSSISALENFVGYTLDPDAEPEVQDEQYQTVIQLAAEGVLEELRVVEEKIAAFEKNRSDINYKSVTESISISQSNISLLLSKVVIAGAGIYETESLKSSLAQIIPTLLKQDDAMTEIQKDLLVVLMSGGLFTFEEALSFWDSEYSAKREQYISSLFRVLRLFSDQFVIEPELDSLKKNRSYLSLVTNLDSPLRSVSGIGLVNYDIICDKLGISAKRLRDYTYLELLAALNTFLLKYDEDFYTKILLLLSARGKKAKVS